MEEAGFEPSVPSGEIELSRPFRLTAAAPLLCHINAQRARLLEFRDQCFRTLRGAVRGDRGFACLDPSERSFAKRRRLKAILA